MVIYPEPAVVPSPVVVVVPEDEVVIYPEPAVVSGPVATSAVLPAQKNILGILIK